MSAFTLNALRPASGWRGTLLAALLALSVGAVAAQQQSAGPTRTSFATPAALLGVAVTADHAGDAATRAAAPLLPAPDQDAPELHLMLTYHTINVGSDGVQREVRYTKRMHRKDNKVWLEKDLPQALRDSMAHGHASASAAAGPHAGHAHTLAQEAPLLVERQADEVPPRVQVIMRDMQRIIDVERGHQGNVGYNGSWAATYWVIPPSSLQHLQPVGSPKDGIQLYRRFADESMTEVAWDIEKQYPRRVLRRGPHDTTYYRLSAEEVPAPEVLPWEQLVGYGFGDYSDLLD
ncbi:hypothetical protein D8I35_12640 [Corticibacter populi]|uniref:Uncharacterized protein n=1 Tax=Corticibacter populi TaxID=1550736 RepID=A0A3M6QSH7_9BURK|nr:hypothetical protein [Corticibacter populi]RMX05978.1 hypothetical protein D8I35_12640 [Corticibacter populi]RZS30691.1 hypothetical protein EV687_2878 [Corticibacter populi]